MRVIAFSGPKTCGKDTAAKCLFKHNTGDGRNYFHHLQMAGGVKGICREMFGYTTAQMEDAVLKETPTETWPHLEPRWPMMDIANWLRDKYGNDVHCRRWERLANTLEDWGAIVVTDLRFPEELEMFSRLGALVIYVERSEAEKALASKQAAGDAKALNPSEAHYALIKAYAQEHGAVINNDASIHNLHNNVNSAVRMRFGHWSHWGAPKSLLQEMREGTI